NAAASTIASKNGATIRTNSNRNNAASSNAKIRRSRSCLLEPNTPSVTTIAVRARNTLIQRPVQLPCHGGAGAAGRGAAPVLREVLPIAELGAAPFASVLRLRLSRCSRIAARNLLLKCPNRRSAMAIYILMALAIIVMIFLGALAFVDAARR